MTSCPISLGRADRRIRVAALAGHIVEWYEFSIYGVLAAYLSVAIFPSDDPASSLALTWATFAVAFVVRPIGGIVLGRLADRAGRRTALLATVALMTVATAGIGFTPGYLAVGALAPLLFIGLRMVQGFAVGGEMPSAVPYFSESLAPDGSENTRIGVLATGPWIAALCGALLAALLASATSPEQMQSWGWRVPFLLALPLGLGSLALRWWAPESGRFAEMVAHAARSRRPLRDAFASSGRSILSFAALAFAFNVCIAVCLGGLTSEALLTGLAPDRVLWVSVVTYAAFIALIIVATRTLKHVPRPRIISAGALLAMLAILPAVALARTGDLTLTMAGCVLMSVPVALLATPTYLAMSDMFPVPVRASAGGISFNTATAVSSLVATTTLATRTTFGFADGLLVWVVVSCGLVVVVALSPWKPFEHVVG